MSVCYGRRRSGWLTKTFGGFKFFFFNFLLYQSNVSETLPDDKTKFFFFMSITLFKSDNKVNKVQLKGLTSYVVNSVSLNLM